LHEIEESARTTLEDIVSRLNLDVAAAFGTSSINDVALDTLAIRVDEWAEPVDRYFEWSKLVGADRTLQNYGLSVFGSRIADGVLSPERAVEELRHARAECLWKLALERNPRLSKLRDLDRTKLVEHFRQLETSRRQLAAALIRARHSAQMPRGAVGHMAIIRGEIAKQKSHMQIPTNAIIFSFRSGTALAHPVAGSIALTSGRFPKMEGSAGSMCCLRARAIGVKSFVRSTRPTLIRIEQQVRVLRC
jgi:hypothetical protein